LDFAQKVLKRAKHGAESDAQNEIAEGLAKYFENFDKDE